MPTPTSSSLALLRTLKLRKTPVRLGVIDVLTRASRPLSVVQILEKLRGVDTVTVYRTLNTFVKKKAIHRVHGEDRNWLYAIGDTQPKHTHPHFVCDECGKVECLEESIVPESLPRDLRVKPKYAVTFSEVVLHGRCPKCVG